jgi:hypothetical protein
VNEALPARGYRRSALDPAAMGGGPAAPRRSPEVLEAVPVSVDMALAATSGFMAATAVSPFILTIDRAVTEYAAGNSTLLTAVKNGTAKLLRAPHRIIASVPFAMVAAVYGSTYAAANMINVHTERKDMPPTQARYTNLFGTTAVNLTSGVAKDAAFAKMFGKKEAANAAKRAVPPISYGLFASRDLLTVGAGFTVPPIMASGLVQTAGMDPGQAAVFAQFTAPPLMQLVCTPLHLLALNMYNAPDATAQERAATVARLFASSVYVRMFRFFCAYGIVRITLCSTCPTRLRARCLASKCTRITALCCPRRGTSVVHQIRTCAERHSCGGCCRGGTSTSFSLDNTGVGPRSTTKQIENAHQQRWRTDAVATAIFVYVLTR